MHLALLLCVSSHVFLKQISLPRTDAVIPPSTDVKLSNQMAIITSFNVSDPYATVVLNMTPNSEVVLRVLLAEGSPPNGTTYKEETYLTSTSKNKNLSQAQATW